MPSNGSTREVVLTVVRLADIKMKVKAFLVLIVRDSFLVRVADIGAVG